MKVVLVLIHLTLLINNNRINILNGESNCSRRFFMSGMVIGWQGASPCKKVAQKSIRF